MPYPIVECVPNFSEARRPEVVEAILEAIASTEGVHVLDLHSDMDHNRSVVTFVGPPEVVEEAAFRGIARAAELIDLDQHQGEHPRIGATDVVPFVPVSGVTMGECVEIARRVGQRVGSELGIPVYLYEEAATRPERVNLENIRHGEYEMLKEEIGVVPEREPDFGPARLGKAGATVIGARPYLIAFNVYLTTEDVSIAKKIARAVRHSSGGLRFVKALGLFVEGRAQVSMNLTDYRRTPVARVVEMIRREAGRYGVGIHHSELVGLIPQEALEDAAIWYLQLDQYDPGQILERKLYASLQEAQGAEVEAEEGLEDRAFLDALASGASTPGGGSASAYAGACAAALVSMVARLTIGKKKYASVEDRMRAILERSEELRAGLAAAVEQDAQAFNQVMAAYRLPKESLQEQHAREDAIELATLKASQTPLEVAGFSIEVLELAAEVAAGGNVNAITDAGTSATLARAALTGAGLNVRINLMNLKNREIAQEYLEQLLSLERRADELEEIIFSTLEDRGGLSLE